MIGCNRAATRRFGMGGVVRNVGLRIDLAFERRIPIKYIAVNECVDEFGRTFGASGTHFFIKLLTECSNREERKQFLIDFYAKNLITSFYDTVKSTKRSFSLENQYFLPWEINRVRNLGKFLGSHKIGPTPAKYLDHILDRILGVFESIEKYGLNQPIPSPDRLIRITPMIRDNDKKFLVRDGHHRLAALSALGIEEVGAINEAAFWQETSLQKSIRKIFRTRSNENNSILKTIDKSNASDWPLVTSGVVSKGDAQRFFDMVFDGSI